MRCIATLTILTALHAGFLYAGDSAPRPLVVHEWGTFTALQDEHGVALPGINVDDEPVPDFVHNLKRHLLVRPHVLAEKHRWMFMKGAPERHPDITMRLETPVLYFYPPPGNSKPLDLRVNVSFRGGWLTEYYPYATALAPGINQDSWKFGRITPDTISQLTWEHVTVGAKGSGPATHDPVWLAPRKVSAAPLSVSSLRGVEHEKYLFYRGVGRLNVPLKIETDEAHDSLTIHDQAGENIWSGDAIFPALWLVSVRADGAMAYRTVKSVVVNRSFDAKDYSTDHVGELRQEMHGALVTNGLFADEAEAMLATWNRAYFKSAGLRLFFVVPRAWTDSVLPLTISQPAKIERVMMGRIELVSPEQRTLLKKLAHLPLSDQKWFAEALKSPGSKSFLEGRSDFGDLGVKIPADYQAYLNLGRFRNALVLAEERAHPTPALSRFINAYGLGAYRPEKNDER